MYGYKKAKNNSFIKILFWLISLVTVSVGSIYLYKKYTEMQGYNVVAPTETAVRLSETQNTTQNITTTSITEILEKNIKSVVGISKIKNTGSLILSTDGVQELGLGTGTIVSENGYIITNCHVSGNKYSTCYVTIENGEKYDGNVVWADENLDLAVVKIKANGLNYLSLGDSDSLKLGQNVYAIGNPIGIEFQRTVTAGIISGLNRTIKITDEATESYMEDLIQTDASINSGNSGGPLINEQGELIGINSVKISSAEGIGFAIPINIIKTIIENFIYNNTFEEATLGIFAYDKEVIPYLNSNLNFSSGIYVVQVNKNTMAYKAGLKVGDIITKIDNQEINKMSELRKYIYTKKVGDTIVLTVLRNQKEYTINVQLSRK